MSREVNAPDTADLLAALRASGEGLFALTDGADLGAVVPACPDWDIAGLLGHVGGLYHFHGATVRRGVTNPPAAGTRPHPPDDRALVAGWASNGFEYLFAALSELPESAPAWNWANEPPVVRFWQRRMTHETLVHRRDAEQAVGAPLTGYGPLAGDGVDEVLAVFLPRALARRPWEGPTGTILVQATDFGAGWVVEIQGGTQLAVRPLGAESAIGAGGGSAATLLRGTAEQLLLALWGREAFDPLLERGDRELASALVVE